MQFLNRLYPCITERWIYRIFSRSSKNIIDDCFDVSMFLPTEDGGWTPWSEWSACTATCGAGTRARHRHCANPRPQFGGRRCDGNEAESEYCDALPVCPGEQRHLVVRTGAMFDVRCSMFDVRCSMLDVRCSMLDVRCSMLDVRCSILDTRYLRCKSSLYKLKLLIILGKK